MDLTAVDHRAWLAGRMVGATRCWARSPRGGMGVALPRPGRDLGRDLAGEGAAGAAPRDEGVLRRFDEGAQLGGQLQHPGIVPVHEVGAMAHRRPFFSMKLVKGRTLAALLASRRVAGSIDKPEGPAKVRRGKPGPTYKPEAPAKVPKGSFRRRFRLVKNRPRSFLGSWQSSRRSVKRWPMPHARRVIHRDLKPANVMVGSFGEVQVMDWGLAKVLPEVRSDDRRPPQALDEADLRRCAAAPAATRHGRRVLGTPAYMAPEQARGELDRLDDEPTSSGWARSSANLDRKAAFRGPDPAMRSAAKPPPGDLADALHRLDTGRRLRVDSLACDRLAADRQLRPRDAGIVSARITAHLPEYRIVCAKPNWRRWRPRPAPRRNGNDGG